MLLGTFLLVLEWLGLGVDIMHNTVTVKKNFFTELLLRWMLIVDTLDDTIFT